VILITHSEANQAINLVFLLRRFKHYPLQKLIDIYLLERNEVLTFCDELSKVYSIYKLNFLNEFNLKSRYLEHCRFNSIEPQKEVLIDRIILFYRTKFLIKAYLYQMQSINI